MGGWKIQPPIFLITHETLLQKKLIKDFIMYTFFLPDQWYLSARFYDFSFSGSYHKPHYG